MKMDRLFYATKAPPPDSVPGKELYNVMMKNPYERAAITIYHGLSLDTAYDTCLQLNVAAALYFWTGMDDKKKQP